MTILTLDLKLLGCFGLMLLSFSEFFCGSLVQAQSGFISIDCGSTDASYVSVDSAALTWVNDVQYIGTGLNGNLTAQVNQTVANYEALQTFRYFPENESRNKHCYELAPLPFNSTVLIRAMFLHGNADELELPILFNVSVNATIWTSVAYSAGDTLMNPIILEGIFPSPGGVIDFCLIPINSVPFISSLEVRALSSDDLMYYYENSRQQWLWSMLRYNGGAPQDSPAIRYPDDQYDRLWYSTSASWDSIDVYRDAVAPDQYTSSGVNSVPPIVMKDAWVDNSSFYLEFSGFDESVTSLYAGLYFEELVSGGGPVENKTSPNRSFNISFTTDVPGNTIGDGSFIIYDLNDTATRFRYEDWNIGSARQCKFTLTALPTSTRGPILNALEVYGQFLFDFSATEAGDVIALESLKTNFNLTDWQSDPCFPVSWNWLGCTYYPSITSARVTKILLSHQGISGTIPANISQLTALTAIQLDNNNLTGPIPDSLTNLADLTTLLLNNNDLSGQIPASLKGLPEFTYSGNSLLDVNGFSPASAPAPGTANGPAPSKKSKVSIGPIIAGVAGGIIIIVLITCCVIGGCCLCRRRKSAIQAEQERQQPKPPKELTAVTYTVGDPIASTPYSPVVSGGYNYSLNTVLVATNNYASKIGEGSFGSVYLGILDGREVAVKVNNTHSNDRKVEFETEIGILTRIHHVKLVKFIGYCDEGGSLILIYEYQLMGTLREWLYATRDNKQVRGFLTWPKRIQIAADAAKGLEYLHKGCIPPIIHRDIKSSNILLDEKLRAKVADFGMSKTMRDKSEKMSGYYTGIKGTPGYVDPEYRETSRLTEKSDVYSFGVVLAELICGRPPLGRSSDGSYIPIVDLLKEFVERADIQAVVDPRLQNDYDVESMWRLADLALSCLRPKGEDRPDMTEVMQNLQIIEMRVVERAYDNPPSMTMSTTMSSSSSLARSL